MWTSSESQESGNAGAFPKGSSKGEKVLFSTWSLLLSFFNRVISFKRTPKVLLCLCLIIVKPLRQHSGILFQYQCC